MRQGRRSEPAISLDDWASWFSFNGTPYGITLNTTMRPDREDIAGDFGGLVQGAYKSNGVVFACMLARMSLFSEARFQFRQIRQGRPGDLFGTSALEILEQPWTNGTTGDLLTRMIQDADLAGNFYARIRPNRLERMRPDWVSIILASETNPETPGWQADATIAGYCYWPGGMGNGDPELMLPEEVVHFAPTPDPAAHFRGMSWLTPVIREIMADGAATRHKLKFFENGATPNLVVKTDLNNTDQFKQWVELMREKSEGLANAYKTLYLGAGADATVVGANFRQIDFKVTQGAGETRIAAASGVPPVIVGLSEGLASATYANYSQARRRFADGTMRPLWRNASASLAPAVNVPSDSELWYDDRDIPFLKEDRKDDAAIQQAQAQAIRTLVDGGYVPESVVEAIVAGDLNRLKHTGLFSVQLQPPGTAMSPDKSKPAGGDSSE